MNARSKHRDAALERSEWLSLARQQSERRAQQLSVSPRFDWGRVDRPRRSGLVWRPLQVLALAGVFLAVVGTATWAFVRSQRREVVTREVRGGRLGELLRDRVAQVGPAPVALRARRTPIRRTITERRVAAQHGRIPARAVAVKTPAGTGAEPALPHRTGPTAGPLSFGDEVIIVAPKAKMKPLFSVQDYRRKHR